MISIERRLEALQRRDGHGRATPVVITHVNGTYSVAGQRFADELALTAHLHPRQRTGGDNMSINTRLETLEASARPALGFKLFYTNDAWQARGLYNGIDVCGGDDLAALDDDARARLVNQSQLDADGHAGYQCIVAVYTDHWRDADVITPSATAVNTP